MNDKDQVIKHLEMIQGIINRLGHDSFLTKGWSMTILVGAIIFIVRSEVQGNYFVLAIVIPIIGFCILDGYFLWQERLFRRLYNKIRMQETTDFTMDTGEYPNKPKCTWASSIFSKTLIVFYLIEMVFVAGACWLI